MSPKPPVARSRRTFLQAAGAIAAWATLPRMSSRGADKGVGRRFRSEPREIRDTVTGRKLIQLTAGTEFDMPMYYYIPTFGADGKSIVFQRYDERTGEVQLYKIHADTGETVQLTAAKTPNSLWRPHLQPPGFGVRDLLCAVNTARNEAIYFDDREIRAVHLDTLADRPIGRVPEDRTPSGLTGVTPNGRLFVYPHFDRAWWEANLPPKPQPERWHPKDSQLVVLDIDTGKTETLMYVNFWITHSNFYDDNRILFCHTATDYAVLMTDLRHPGQYENIRAHSADGWPNHYNVTSRGITYEMLTNSRSGPTVAGIYDPDTRRRREYRLAMGQSRLHIGRDPDARLWFFETAVDGSPTIMYFPKLAAGNLNPGQALIGGEFATYSNNQRSHFHPSVTPDRKHILFTGGDARNKTNHLFLLDIADLADTELVG
jgi:Tol biopolymer transport system component